VCFKNCRFSFLWQQTVASFTNQIHLIRICLWQWNHSINCNWKYVEVGTTWK
jgi:hypothetical protein